MNRLVRQRDAGVLLPPCDLAAISPATVTSDDWWRLDGPPLGGGDGGGNGGGSDSGDARPSAKPSSAAPVDEPTSGVASPLLLSAAGAALACSPWDVPADEHSLLSCAGMGLAWADGAAAGGDAGGLGPTADLPFLALPPTSGGVHAAAAVAAAAAPPPRVAAPAAPAAKAYTYGAVAASPDAGSDVTLFDEAPRRCAAAGVVASGDDMTSFAALLGMDQTPMAVVAPPPLLPPVTLPPSRVATPAATTAAAAVAASARQTSATPLPSPPPTLLLSTELPDAIESKVRELEQLIFAEPLVAPSAVALPPPPPPPPPPPLPPPPPPTWRVPAAAPPPPARRVAASAASLDSLESDLWLAAPRLGSAVVAPPAVPPPPPRPPPPPPPPPLPRPG